MNILDLREKRYNLYKKIGKNILSIKANVMGEEKEISIQIMYHISSIMN